MPHGRQVHRVYHHALVEFLPPTTPEERAMRRYIYRAAIVEAEIVMRAIGWTPELPQPLEHVVVPHRSPRPARERWSRAYIGWEEP